MSIEYFPGKLNKVADYLTRNPGVAPTCHHCKAKININQITSGDLNESLIKATITDQLAQDWHRWKADPGSFTPAEAMRLRQFTKSNGLLYCR